MMKLKCVTGSLRSAFFQGLRQRATYDPSLLPIIGSLAHPYFKQFVEIQHPGKCTKIMLKSPLVGHIDRQNLGVNVNIDYNYVFQAWCQNYEELSDHDFNEFLSIYQKGEGIQETDQRLVDDLFVANGMSAQGAVEDSHFLIHRPNTKRIVEKELQDYRIDFCTPVDFAEIMKMSPSVIVLDELKFSIKKHTCNRCLP